MVTAGAPRSYVVRSRGRRVARRGASQVEGLALGRASLSFRVGVLYVQTMSRTEPRRSIGTTLALAAFVAISFGAACDKSGEGTQAPADPFACSGAALQPKAMHEAMIGEDKGEVFDTNVAYFDETQREAYVVTIEAGSLVDADGQPFDTAGQLAIYVLSPEGVLYASAEQEQGKFHHSSFLAGGPVAGAGELIAAEGKVTLLTDHSGHYRPGKQETGQALCWFADQGVDLAAVEFHPYSGGTLPASSMVSRSN